jgi:FtsZ-interacting cell division protein YlmF
MPRATGDGDAARKEAAGRGRTRPSVSLWGKIKLFDKDKEKDKEKEKEKDKANEKEAKAAEKEREKQRKETEKQQKKALSRSSLLDRVSPLADFGWRECVWADSWRRSERRKLANSVWTVRQSRRPR